MSSVVVSGVGTVGAFGAGWTALTGALAAGDVASAEIGARGGDPPAAEARGYARALPRSRRALLVPERGLDPWLPSAQARRMSWPSRLTVVAGRLALADAGLGMDDPGAAETAIAVATAFGPASYTERLLFSIFHQGPEQASPALFTESVASAAPSQLAIQTRCLGPCVTITQREAGLLQSVAEGERLISAGRARRALVGGVEEMTPLLHGILDRFGALTRDRARPFDRRRDGMVAAEGATILLLEAENEALARGIRPWARILGWGSMFDPSASPLGWGTGSETLARGLRRGLERCALERDSLDLVVSGTSATRAGDHLEAEVLTRLFGRDRLPPIVAPKGQVGEYGGAFLAAALLAQRDALVPRLESFVADEALGIVPFGGSLAAPPRRVLVTTQAAGGSAAWVVFERWDSSGGA